MSFFSLCAVFKVHMSFDFSESFAFSVEMKGFEPLTPCLQGRCSPN